VSARVRLVSAAAVLVTFAVGLAVGVRWQREIRAALGQAQAPEPAAAAAAAGQLWTCGMHPQVIQEQPGTCPICGMALTPLATGGAGARTPEGEREIAYWWDPMMSPPYVSERPGKSPMGMALVPVYADEVSAGAAVLIDPAVVQNMGLRIATVVEAPLTRRIRAVGALAEPEPARHDVNLRVGGWIEELHADTEGMRIAAGDPLFDLYSPALQLAIEELIGARRLRDASAAAEQADVLHAAAVRKLELYGLGREQIESLAALETAPRAVTFTSPADGFLVQKSVYAGSAVEAGDTVLRIADTSRLWLDARVFERDLPHVELGQPVTASVDGLPGETFEGRVVLVHPRIDPTTRTALVRMELENPALALRHGMFATVFLTVEIAERAVVVPRTAIIDSGTRQVAFVARAMGHFEPREVRMGAHGEGGMVQVLAGLAPGDEVVVSGQFLLDAESRMQAAIQRFLQAKALPSGGAGGAGGAPGPEPEAPADTGPLIGASAAWSRGAEEALAAYIDVARVLGLPQSADEPVDVGPLVGAARALAELAEDERQAALAGSLVSAADAMSERALDEQRVLFGAVSAAALELALRSPRTGTRVPRLLLARCPMVSAPWLQADEEIANPYYATTMKACGEIERRLPIPGARDAAEHGEHR
jgi:RND family efflux transporter MFP subunit